LFVCLPSWIIVMNHFVHSILLQELKKWNLGKQEGIFLENKNIESQ